MKNLNVKIVGLGEGGTRSVSKMMAVGVGKKFSAEFVGVGNDENLLLVSTAQKNIFLNRDNVTIQKNLSEALDGAKIIFIVAGTGGSAATKAIPLIMAHAKKLKAATVAFVNLPSALETKSRRENSFVCLNELATADALFTVPAEKLFLFRLNQKEVLLNDLFTVADDIFCRGVKNFLATLGAAEKFSNVIKWGNASFCYGEAEGIDSALEAVKDALKFPTLDLDELKHAPKILVHVTGGDLFFKTTADAAKKFFKEEISSDAKLMWIVDKDSSIVKKVCASIVYARPSAVKAENNSAFPSLKKILDKFSTKLG